MASEFKPQYPPQRAGVSYGMLGGQAVYFSKPSSRAPNRSDTVEGIGEVRFSHPRGFYDQPFLLAIHTETPGAPTDVAE